MTYASQTGAIQHESKVVCRKCTNFDEDGNGLKLNGNVDIGHVTPVWKKTNFSENLF